MKFLGSGQKSPSMTSNPGNRQGAGNKSSVYRFSTRLSVGRKTNFYLMGRICRKYVSGTRVFCGRFPQKNIAFYNPRASYLDSIV